MAQRKSNRKTLGGKENTIKSGGRRQSGSRPKIKPWVRPSEMQLTDLCMIGDTKFHPAFLDALNSMAEHEGSDSTCDPLLWLREVKEKDLTIHQLLDAGVIADCENGCSLTLFDLLPGHDTDYCVRRLALAWVIGLFGRYGEPLTGVICWSPKKRASYGAPTIPEDLYVDITTISELASLHQRKQWAAAKRWAAKLKKVCNEAYEDPGLVKSRRKKAA